LTAPRTRPCNGDQDAADRFTWSWTSGSATTLGEFGDPVGATDYTLCLYDMWGPTSALLFRAVAPAGGVCAGPPCWQPKGIEREAPYPTADVNDPAKGQFKARASFP
jgi:hypothetical protein